LLGRGYECQGQTDRDANAGTKGTAKKYFQTTTAFTTNAMKNAAMMGRIRLGALFANGASCQNTTACTAR
jgi:hypothetical protein